MTWPEICDELIKRWPDRFRYDESDDIELSRGFLPNGCTWYHFDPSDLMAIHVICTAIGAVVWSYPAIQYTPRKRMWHGAFFDQMPRDVMEYPTRAEAELAALATWLEATR